MTAFRKNDPVKVEFDGRVSLASEDGVHLWVCCPDDMEIRVNAAYVTPIEPGWQPGDVVRDENGIVWERCLMKHPDCWSWGERHTSYDTQEPYGRLTRLVPEGSAS